MPILLASARHIQIIAAADAFAGKRKARCLCSAVKSAVCFLVHFSVHSAEGTYAPSSHVLPCACFGRIRPKYVMRRAFRATFRPAENEDTGKKRDKRQEGSPQETGRSPEILLVRRRAEHMFHVKHSLSYFSQNVPNSFPSAYLFLHIKKVKTIVLNKHNEKED